MGRRLSLISACISYEHEHKGNGISVSPGQSVQAYLLKLEGIRDDETRAFLVETARTMISSSCRPTTRRSERSRLLNRHFPKPRRGASSHGPCDPEAGYLPGTLGYVSWEGRLTEQCHLCNPPIQDEVGDGHEVCSMSSPISRPILLAQTNRAPVLEPWRCG